MALTYSPQVELDSICPDFNLPSVDGKAYARKDFADASALLVMFICNHCPYVKAVEDRLIKLAADLKGKGVRTVAICSNDPSEYPEDEPKQLLQRWRQKEYGFPYLIDATQEVAQAFGAVCTPDFFAFDSKFRLKYRGRLDDSWKDPTRVTNQELREGLLKIVNKEDVGQPQRPSMGCSIKWKNK